MRVISVEEAARPAGSPARDGRPHGGAGRRRVRAGLRPLLLLSFLIGCDDVTGPALPEFARVVYTSIDSRFLRVWVQDLDGSSRAGLTPDDETSLEPSWVPNEQLAIYPPRIVYTSWRDGDANIYRMASNGTLKEALTTHPANDRTGRFAPDGRRLAFVSERDGRPDVFVVTPGSGSEPVNISASPTTNDVDPDWSPDGERLAFLWNDEALPWREVWLVEADGTGLRRLTTPSGGSGVSGFA
ncbi:MAG: hypothetical protein MJB57_16245, partial [Gemmatimonadetes bacterium]|nr:hypothetical protein [Gemmatimonadota bacterium]